MTPAIYDTTLRDGAQQEGISFSVQDKLKIACLLDRLGVDYIEGGWPGSNPKEAEFFQRACDLDLDHATLTAFGSTRRAGRHVEDDPGLAALLCSRTAAVALFGKASAVHVRRVLRTTAEENLRMIEDSVAYMTEHDRSVVYDAEHFFDGYREDPDYSIATLEAAARAGADVLVLCDTNGGSLPDEIATITAAVAKRFSISIGIHAHNDGEMAVANSLAAIQAGASHVQGTINGLGERCGNANLCSILPALRLKMGRAEIPRETLERLTETARAISEIANLQPDPNLPYVGESAFAHKGGMHVDALAKYDRSYQHIDPQLVGNRNRVLVSELSGKGNIAYKARELGLDIGTGGTGGPRGRRVLAQIKDLESRGFQFDGAEGSVELLLQRSAPGYQAPFELMGFHVLVSRQEDGKLSAEAAVKLRVGDEVIHTAAEGNGPVNALDAAVRKALLPVFPRLDSIHLTDYKVRILDSAGGTAARTRVLITTSGEDRSWSTVGCSANIIEASWIALGDALEYAVAIAGAGTPRTVEARG